MAEGRRQKAERVSREQRAEQGIFLSCLEWDISGEKSF
jgi:hypothetical protein